LDITTGIIGFVILILIGIVFLYRREYIWDLANSQFCSEFLF
jgi:hypothetical protein